MRKKINKKVTTKPKERFKNFSSETKKDSTFFFNVANTLISIFIGVIGIYLAFQANKLNVRMLEISVKQDSTTLDLRHFSQLLNKTDTVISGLNEQLILLREQQSFTNKNLELENLSNEGKFYFAVQTLQSIIIQSTNYSNIIYTPQLERETFINRVELILESQLENPFLTANKFISKDWIIVHDSIHRAKIDFQVAKYYADSPNIAIEKRNKAWLSVFYNVLDLSKSTNGFMRYYRRQENKGFVKPEDYIKIKLELTDK